MAVIACGPAVRNETDSAAAPWAPRGAVPRDVAPSKKVTMPVGVPVAAATSAVRCTAWPTTGEATSATRDVAVGATWLDPPRLYRPIRLLPISVNQTLPSG